MLPVLSALLAFIAGLFRSRASLCLEHLALRHQLAVYKQTVACPRLRSTDWVLWAWLSRLWPGWHEALAFVQPRTVIAWQRQRFRDYWRRLSQRGMPGRPPMAKEVRDLIRKMWQTNPTWGAPRIVGELRKLGIEVAKSTVEKFRVRPQKPPSPTWKAFLTNHMLYLLRDRDRIYGASFRQRVQHMGIEEVVIAPRSPWQNPYVERLIGSIRRECLDHVIVLHERHVMRLLAEYFQYYHYWHTHRDLTMDCPVPRPVQRPEVGSIREVPEVGGLHHHDERRAA
jgi:transposase InsO family protein